MKNNSWFKLVILALILISIGLFFAFDLDRLVTFASLKAQLGNLQEYYAEHRLLVMGVYFAAYIIVTGLSLPGAAVMSLAGGALFGLLYGVLLVSFASSIGATVAFLFSRYLLGNWVQQKFGEKLSVINRGIEKEGGFYLFSLRLVPIFPFFVINLVMGLTKIRTSVYYVVSQLGMLPATIVFINAGTQLAAIESVKGIISPGLLFSFALLGIFPLVAKAVISRIKIKKLYARFKEPEQFEYNLVVIGAGSAGLISSLIAAAVKAKVALIEAHKMGGDCLNTGCVPSKSLIASAKFAHLVNRSREFGFEEASARFEFKTVMERVHSIIKKIEPHDSVERFTQLGVDCIQGKAKVISPYEVLVNDTILTTRSIIIATGATPFIPDLPGFDPETVLTSDTLWNIRALPEKLVVMGAGPIGCEMAQAFARLGSKVILVQRDGQIMPREDSDAAQLVQEQFEKDGVKILLHHEARAIESSTDKDDGLSRELVCYHNGKEVRVAFDQILVALGRRPNINGLGLEKIGVELDSRGVLENNDFLQTNFPNIYCAGDVHGGYQFTHTASHEAWYASVNALFGRFKKFRADYRVIPWATFTDPEVARVGLSEAEAKTKKVPFEVVKYGIDDLDRAIADSEAKGFVKVLTVPGKDKILGVTIVGYHASDLIAEFVLAMKNRIGLNKILGTIHIYPTMAEANKYAAGMWKKAHVPERLLGWVEKYHARLRKQKTNK